MQSESRNRTFKRRTWPPCPMQIHSRALCPQMEISGHTVGNHSLSFQARHPRGDHPETMEKKVVQEKKLGWALAYLRPFSLLRSLLIVSEGGLSRGTAVLVVWEGDLSRCVWLLRMGINANHGRNNKPPNYWCINTPTHFAAFSSLFSHCLRPSACCVLRFSSGSCILYHNHLSRVKPLYTNAKH
jgi:hypothetical protein